MHKEKPYLPIMNETFLFLFTNAFLFQNIQTAESIWFCYKSVALILSFAPLTL